MTYPNQPLSPPKGMAITALILGILSLIIPVVGLLLAIAALVLGIIVLTQVSSGKAGGKGMAIGGVVTGGLGLLCAPALLISILLPALSQAREQANRAKCASNMHQIGLAIIMYSNGDSEGQFPVDLPSLITTQQLSPDAFICPSTNNTVAPGTTAAEQASHLMDGGHESYVYVGVGLTSKSPADAVVLYEPVSNHQNHGGNVLFADGHVEFLLRPAIEQITQDDQSGARPVYYPPHAPQSSTP